MWFSAIIPSIFSSLKKENKQIFRAWFFPFWQGNFVSFQLAQHDTTLQYSNQGPFLFHVLLRLNNLIEVCVYMCVHLCMYWWLLEELTNTMQLLFSSGDEQSGNDFRCPERFQCWDSARLIHTGYTLSNIHSLLHIWNFPSICTCRLRFAF